MKEHLCHCKEEEEEEEEEEEDDDDDEEMFRKKSRKDCKFNQASRNPKFCRCEKNCGKMNGTKGASRFADQKLEAKGV